MSNSSTTAGPPSSAFCTPALVKKGALLYAMISTQILPSASSSALSPANCLSKAAFSSVDIFTESSILLEV